MGGNLSTKDRINKAYRIIRKTSEIKKEDIAKMEAMLYAMADKFLDAKRHPNAIIIGIIK